MAGYLVSVLAATGLATASFAAASGVRSADVLPVQMLASGAAGAGQCTVKVVRSATPGVAQVLREDGADGSCSCTVTTGPAAGNGSAESVVEGILRDRTCAKSPSGESTPGEQAVKAAGAGGPGGMLPVVLGAVGAGGLAAGLASSSNG